MSLPRLNPSPKPIVTRLRPNIFSPAPDSPSNPIAEWKNQNVSTHASNAPSTSPGPSPKLTKEQIMVALAKAGGNKKKAAELLGVGRATLYRYLRTYELH